MPRSIAVSAGRVAAGAYISSVVAGIRHAGSIHYEDIGSYRFAFKLLENGRHDVFIHDRLVKLIDFDAT